MSYIRWRVLVETGVEDGVTVSFAAKEECKEV